MNYAEIKYFDIANGPGVRTSLFVSGCTHHCEGCFNDIAWDFGYGKPFTESVWEEIYESLKPHYITGVTLLGGEPFEPQNQKGLIGFIREYKRRFPEKTLWIYSGYTYEELTGAIPSRCRTDITDEILSYTDVLVDGKFEIDKKNIMLRFRGSENQRLIDIRKTLKSGQITEWTDDPVYGSHTMD